MARSVPLYLQIESVLRQRIKTNQYVPGSVFPTEERLQHEFGVSRATVRLALEALQREGLIARHAGRGTFVNGAVQPPGRLTLKGSLEEIVAHADGASSSEFVVLEQGLYPATPAQARELDLADGALLTRVTGVRRRGEERIAHVVVCVPERLGSLLALRPNEVHPPVIALLRRELGQVVREVRQAICVQLADAQTAEALRIDVGTPLLAARRTYLSANGAPVEYAVSSYPGERYQYEMTIRGSD